MEMLGRGETFGVFQLESSGMRRYVQDLKPTNVADLCAMVALYRPGPMQHIPRYIAGKHGEVTITYPHADLADVLDETYGVIVYQDQVMLIARNFAGYTLGEADVMRKAMGKKKAEIMQAEKSRFVDGAMRNGYTEKEATDVFELIEPFAGYAFNKAHSWCYGNIAYQTAYLKANYPVEYMAAVLELTRSAPDPHARIAAAVAECTKLGIEVLPPDINRSIENFSVERMPDGTSAIRFGLGVVKNVGASGVEGIIAARIEGGPYADIEDFCKRADLSAATSRVVEHLAMVGAMDMLGYERGTVVVNAERLVNLAKRERELRESGQSTMFDLFGSQVDTPMPAVELEEHHVGAEQMLAWEKELLGVYVSEHPFRAAAGEIAKYASHAISDLGMELAGQPLTLGGMVSGVQTRTTRDGRKFYIINFEDLSGTAELTVWNDVIDSHDAELWSDGQVLIVSVDARERAERLNLSVRKAARFDRAEGVVVGFAPEQWQVEAAKEAPKRRAAANGSGQQANGSYQNGQAARAARAERAAGGPTAEASSAKVAPPVNGDAARIAITIYETESEVHDQALLRSVVGLLNDSPGKDQVRLVIHDAEGQELEFDLPTANVNQRLADSVRAILKTNGTVAVNGARSTAA
jgi:DNA polymerase-3 subunit alpha